jgi:hypothetical protein
MNTREAILKAADHIERNPHLFRFSRTEIPDCGTPGCALGWIGFFMGIEVGACILSTQPAIASDRDFYDRMTALTDPFWIVSSETCAKGLRLYANKYHPAEIAEISVSSELNRIFANVRAKEAA